jgi:hypothetical protein
MEALTHNSYFQRKNKEERNLSSEMSVNFSSIWNEEAPVIYSRPEKKSQLSTDSN